MKRIRMDTMENSAKHQRTMTKTIASSVIFLLLALSSCKSEISKTNETVKETKVPERAAIQISVESKNAAEPAIAADSTGNIFVIYVDHAEKSADVILQKLDSDAKPVGERVRVNPIAGIATAWFGDAPTISIGSDNVIYVGWTAKDPNAGKSSATVLNLSVSRDGGKSFAEPVKVNDDTSPSSHGMHSLAVDKNNRVYMAWLDERNIKLKENAALSGGDKIVEPKRLENTGGFNFINIHNGEDHKKKPKPSPTIEFSEAKDEITEPNSEIFAAVSNDGGRTFSKNQKISSEVCPCCKTSLAIDKNGKIYASWRQVLPGNFRHIAVATTTDGGETFSDYTIVSDDKWEINACPVSGAPMFVGKNNALKIFWYTAGEAGKPGLYTAESNDGGKSFLPRTLIHEGAVNGTLSVFPKNGSDFGAIFDNMGEVFQTDQSLNPFKVFEGELPAAIFGNGKTYVAFVKKSESFNGIWVQIF